MSNEIATTNPVSMLDLYKSLQKEATEDADALADVNADDLIPVVSLSRESQVVNITIGPKDSAENVSGSGSKSVFLILFDILAARALWAPQGDETFTWPLCSTDWMSPRDVSGQDAHGSFCLNDKYQSPTGIYNTTEERKKSQYRCNVCPYNEYGSMAEHDTSREASNAKACGESRIYIVLPVNKGERLDFDGEDLFMFTPDKSWATSMNPMGIGKMSLSYGTNKKQIQAISTMVAARGLPLGACVFRISNLHKKLDNGFTVALLNAGLAGYIHPDEYNRLRSNLKPWLKKYIEDHKRDVIAETNDRQQVVKSESEIPF